MAVNSTVWLQYEALYQLAEFKAKKCHFTNIENFQLKGMHGVV
jgi:hypothetical protein